MIHIAYFLNRLQKLSVSAAAWSQSRKTSLYQQVMMEIMSCFLAHVVVHPFKPPKTKMNLLSFCRKYCVDSKSFGSNSLHFHAASPCVFFGGCTAVLLDRDEWRRDGGGDNRRVISPTPAAAPPAAAASRITDSYRLPVDTAVFHVNWPAEREIAELFME